MKIFGFIPARYHSTRFPGKPLAPIAGKPMIQHVYERAASCPEFSDIYVVTDDDRILSCVRGFGGKAVMTRKSHRTGTDRICEAAREMGLDPEDIIINIQGDQPLFYPSFVSQLVRPLAEDRSLGMVTLKWKIEGESDVRNPNQVKVVTDMEGYALYFSRSEIPFVRDAGLETLHYKHLGVYAFRMEFLVKFTGLPQGLLELAERLEQLRALEHGLRVKVVETPLNSIEVDVPEDVEEVERLLEKT